MKQSRLDHQIEAILDQQDAIEAASYDANTGRQAVFAARKSIQPLLGNGQSGTVKIDAIIIGLEGLRERQKNSAGEYSTGAATIGSILSEVRRLRPREPSRHWWKWAAPFALFLLVSFPDTSANACLQHAEQTGNLLLPHGQRMFHGLYDVVIEGDAQSVLVMEIWVSADKGASLFIIPSSSFASWTIPICRAAVTVTQHRADELDIKISDGCDNPTETWRYDATGLHDINE
ncbi:hypothetical protein [Hoeflea alexandrii]|uniref:hypothetical protein n=1 Tax=Hoeflea alexandrii TaxID=288436 RepID=UPI0022AE6A2D|nr:hypothetical protein [Hoeflea alexandrii]MCZ4287847.1 hypothetical protein [Hoeflea alexandrii]